MAFKLAQETKYTDVPIQDHIYGDKGGYKYYGWFYEYAEANPQYKTMLQVVLNPVETDDIIIMEIFIEDDFVRDFISARDLKYADVDLWACHELEDWITDWFIKYDTEDNK